MSMLVAPPDPDWPVAFVEEAARVKAVLGTEAVALHHIGSTAVPGIFAKPVIDMLCEARSLAGIDRLGADLEAIGYHAKGENGIAGRRYFWKAGADGRRSHQLHIFAPGAPQIEQHLAFRDFLIAVPDAARRYSDLKRAIAAEPGMTRHVYQDRKTAFVAALLEEAMAWRRAQT